jgi:hypothetical protein
LIAAMGLKVTIDIRHKNFDFSPYELRRNETSSREHQYNLHDMVAIVANRICLERVKKREATSHLLGSGYRQIWPNEPTNSPPWSK